eukprot:9252781-Alexandrium_andersonii.AAC.1
MSASLVGSEMCIRDSPGGLIVNQPFWAGPAALGRGGGLRDGVSRWEWTPARFEHRRGGVQAARRVLLGSGRG